jgi:hypothetical protein
MVNGADHWERIIHQKCYIPFSIEPLFNYIVFYLWAELPMVFAISYILANEILLNTLILMVAMEFDNLADEFEKFDYKCDDKKKKFKELVDRHNELLALADELNLLFRLPIFVTLLISATIICFSMLPFLSKNRHLSELLNLAKFAGYLICNILQILQLCIFCQKLRTASENIERKIMMGHLHECTDLTMLKDMQLVLLKAQKPVELQAWVFFGINLETFTNVNCNILNYGDDILIMMMMIIFYRCWPVHSPTTHA